MEEGWSDNIISLQTDAMSNIISAILDPCLDLQLLSLSLHDNLTHKFLVQTHLLRPTLPPPTPTHHSKHIVVPHLRFPWAPTLCEQIWLHLRIRLIPNDSRPVLAIDRFLEDISIIGSPAFERCVDSFYPEIPASDVQCNSKYLSRIHPGALTHIATCVKLVYANNLRHSLSTYLQQASSSLATSVTPPTVPFAITACIPPCRTSIRRTGAAESGILIPRHRISSCRTITLPKPKPIPRSGGVTIVAQPLKPVRGTPPRYLLHGMVLYAHLSPVVTSMLSQYGINVLTNSTSSPPIALSNLSNSGSALLARPLCGTGDMPPRRKPSEIYDPVDAHIYNTYGIPWTQLCAAIVKRATAIVHTKRIDELSTAVEQLKQALAETETVRVKLINDAIRQEVAGGSLSTMCAYKIAQCRTEEFESRIGRFSDEYVEHVFEARRRIWELSRVENRNVAALVSTGRLGK